MNQLKITKGHKKVTCSNLAITTLTSIRFTKNSCGFHWNSEGKLDILFLQFTLSSSSFIFTKVILPLAKICPFNGIKIACYLDDGIGIAYSFFEAKENYDLVRYTVIKAGLIPNEEKPIWQQTCELAWFLVSLDLFQGVFEISQENNRKYFQYHKLNSYLCLYFSQIISKVSRQSYLNKICNG